MSLNIEAIRQRNETAKALTHNWDALMRDVGSVYGGNPFADITMLLEEVDRLNCKHGGCPECASEREFKRVMAPTTRRSRPIDASATGPASRRTRSSAWTAGGRCLTRSRRRRTGDSSSRSGRRCRHGAANTPQGRSVAASSLTKNVNKAFLALKVRHCSSWNVTKNVGPRVPR